MQEKYNQLLSLLQRSQDLQKISAVLQWDQLTYMPPRGAPARARQLATISQLAHEKSIDPQIGELLDALAPYEESLPYDSDEASLIRLARRQYERAIKVPPAFMAKFNAHLAESYAAWSKAAPESNFKAVQPFLEKTLEMSREMANFFPGYEHIADPLIDINDYGMKAKELKTLFSELRRQLVPIVQAISEQEPADNAFLLIPYAGDKQRAFAEKMIQEFGYSFERGRQDLSPHPFTISFAIDDVRITTRVIEDEITNTLFSSVHESGHAFYELGIDPKLDGTPLARGASSGVHEGSSRLWENQVGRSRALWEHYYEQLQAVFPDQLQSISLDHFYRGINKVQPSLIRTEADEVTYNLHVMIRFDLELEMLEGKLAIADLPDAWNARYESDLGITPPDHRRGVMQDVHWYSSPIGGSFQGYTLGNILSAQFFEQALLVHPDIPDQMRQGKFGALLDWLKENWYTHGSKFTANELVERICGGPMQIEPYIRYLKDKFGELYELAG